MSAMSFDTSEVDALANDLAAAPIKVTAKTTGVVRKVARETQRNAQRFAPVLTGALRDSITSHAYGLHAEISANIRYSGYVEFGTSDTRPQPYMRPAAELAYQPLLDGFGDAGEHIL